jgi:hypothetical protein
MSTTSARRVIPRHSVTGMTLRILIPFDAIALLFAGIVHLVGVRIPLGVAIFVEPTILPAGIVETAAGLIFVWATVALWRERASAWTAALVAHLFAIAGFLVGLFATRLGTTPFNALYHRVMLAVFVAGLILLLLPTLRSAQWSSAQRTN